MKSNRNPEKKKEVKRKRLYEMVCKSNPKKIGDIEGFLHQISKAFDIDEGTMYRLLVSCTEAVNNAMIHGNKSDPKKKVIIRCLVGKEDLTLCVKDEGTGFDPNSLQDPREEKNLLKENGRGVFIMRSLMDSISVKKTKSGSAVKMKLKLHSHS
jgi:serine/threonine-protein kinase RsbW